ncbi:MAG: Holliday junction resolvase [Planctomycetota bacterium]|nr:MAG: Holliday junction resolvase [Planctomycetota bacterium]
MATGLKTPIEKVRAPRREARDGIRAEAKSELQVHSTYTDRSRVLGIDPGLDRTGYAVVEMPLGRVIEAGLIRSNARRRLEERLVELADGIEEVMKEHCPTLVGVEELFAHYAHPKTAILMGHARGIVLLTAARRGVEVMGILPNRVKKMLTGNGHASKLQMQKAVAVTLGLPRLPEPSDVADAIAIAWCAGRLETQIRAATARARGRAPGGRNR